MSLVNDIIKIKFIESGYLPDYPYHLISDNEMLDAFISPSENSNDYNQGYMFDMYPIDDSWSDELKSAYNNLIKSFKSEIDNYKSDNSNNTISDRLYSYMLGSVIGPNSDKRDIHDLLVLLGYDNIDDIFTQKAAERCLSISSDMYTNSPSMFGELYVIQVLRRLNALSN